MKHTHSIYLTDLDAKLLRAHGGGNLSRGISLLANTLVQSIKTPTEQAREQILVALDVLTAGKPTVIRDSGARVFPSSDDTEISDDEFPGFNDDDPLA